MDNQTTFIVGEGSSLTVGKAENTGAVISAIGNGTIEIQNYTGKDLNNYDTLRTTGVELEPTQFYEKLKYSLEISASCGINVVYQRRLKFYLMKNYIFQ